MRGPLTQILPPQRSIVRLERGRLARRRGSGVSKNDVAANSAGLNAGRTEKLRTITEIVFGTHLDGRAARRRCGRRNCVCDDVRKLIARRLYPVAHSVEPHVADTRTA